MKQNNAIIRWSGFHQTIDKNIRTFEELETDLIIKLKDITRLIYEETQAVHCFSYDSLHRIPNCDISLSKIYHSIDVIYNILFIRYSRSPIIKLNIQALDDFNEHYENVQLLDLINRIKLIIDSIRNAPPVINNNICSLLKNRMCIISNYYNYEIPCRFICKNNNLYYINREAIGLYNKRYHDHNRQMPIFEDFIMDNLYHCLVYTNNK